MPEVKTYPKRRFLDKFSDTVRNGLNQKFNFPGFLFFREVSFFSPEVLRNLHFLIESDADFSNQMENQIVPPNEKKKPRGRKKHRTQVFTICGLVMNSTQSTIHRIVEVHSIYHFFDNILFMVPLLS